MRGDGQDGVPRCDRLGEASMPVIALSPLVRPRHGPLRSRTFSDESRLLHPAPDPRYLVEPGRVPGRPDDGTIAAGAMIGELASRTPGKEIPAAIAVRDGIGNHATRWSLSIRRVTTTPSLDQL